MGHDAATTDAGADADTPLPTPDWDAGTMFEGPPFGNAYVEKKGSFKLLQPAALAGAYGVLAADTMDVRLFYNELYSGDAGAGVEYGSVFLEADNETQYQYPKSVGSFHIARSKEDPLTFVSEPFDYRLHAWVPSADDPNRGYLLKLSAVQAIWAAKFTSDFASIEQGKLKAAVLPSEAEAAAFELDPFTCLLVCRDTTACVSGLSHVSDLLACNGTKLTVDTNGDGEADAYELRIEFSSERVVKP